MERMRFESLVVEMTAPDRGRLYGTLADGRTFKRGQIVHVEDGAEDQAYAIVDHVEGEMVYVDVIWPTFGNLDAFHYDATTGAWWTEPALTATEGADDGS